MAKKQQEAPEKITLEAALAKIATEHPGAVRAATAGLAVRLPRLATDFFRLDLALAGGIPAGRITLIAGRKGSMKTTTALRAVAAFQRLCIACYQPLRLFTHLAELYDARVPVCWCETSRPGIALWIDAEGVWDQAWAEAHGVDTHPSRLRLVIPEFAEQGIDIVEYLLRVEEVALVVLDSIAQLVPSTEIEKSAMDWQQGLLARLVAKFVHKVTGGMNAGKQVGLLKTVILINQIREKITGFGPVVEIEPGGHAQRFASSVILRLKPAYPAFEWDGVKANGTPPQGRPPDRAVAAFTVQASKVSPPRIEGEMSFYLTPKPGKPLGYSDDVDAVYDLAKKLRVIYRERNQWHCLGRTFRTEEDIPALWLKDVLAFGMAKRRVIEQTYAASFV